MPIPARRPCLALLLAALAVTLAACEAPPTYPVSGETCGPSDPVQTMHEGSWVGLCP